MGTHPIFESDFDCLTEMNRLLSRRCLSVSERVAGGIRPGTLLPNPVKGIVTTTHSPYTMNTFKEWTETNKWIPRTFRRFHESWLFWVPVFTFYYIHTIWGNTTFANSQHKNPADFVNDV